MGSAAGHRRLVAVLGWWGNNQLRETIEGELKAQLTDTLNANVTALGIWATKDAGSLGAS